MFRLLLLLLLLSLLCVIVLHLFVLSPTKVTPTNFCMINLYKMYNYIKLN